ncbi:hypothetical protein Fmac_023698 [Flemingia macrophylla]|uniref:BZIP domain-containing protein n=1 Tax=Flemingia macrophylla TaxID=520843 RepID=A0ABD1LM95_9FABA
MASESSPSPSPTPQFTTANFMPLPDAAPRTVDDVWREIVAGDCKEEALDNDNDDYMMTLEDFLVKAGAVDDHHAADDADVKMPMPPVLSFDPPPFQDAAAAAEVSVLPFGNGVEGGRGKRPRPVLEQLDKAAQQRQRRMIKNRESAARSRERKQAYQVELESLAVRLEDENDMLIKEKVAHVSCVLTLPWGCSHKTCHLAISSLVFW